MEEIQIVTLFFSGTLCSFILSLLFYTIQSNIWIEVGGKKEEKKRIKANILNTENDITSSIWQSVVIQGRLEVETAKKNIVLFKSL